MKNIILEKFNKNLSKFPDGRIDYHDSREAAVINVFILYKNRLLLLKRSDKVGNYKGRWNVVAGFYDEPKPVKQKALEEVFEETGILETQILKIDSFPVFKLDDKEIDKIFYVFSVLICLKDQPKIKLDWEHTEYEWINPKNMTKYETVYGLDKIRENVGLFIR